jgi:hypothetical protein
MTDSSPSVRTMVGFLKKTVSMILILFCVVIVSAAIFTKQTSATGKNSVHPVIAFCVFWFSLLWLALMEGGLNCMVGLQPIDKTIYSTSHPRTLRCTSIAHKGDNIERFIVGRQYLDLMIVFTTSFMVSATEDANVLGLPQIVNDIFLGSDLAVILCTIVFGQLIAQINSAPAMLDFMNNWVMVATTYVAMFVESSGILHAVYLVQLLFTKLAGKTTGESKEPEKTLVQKVLFWLRVLISFGISVFAIVVFSTALFGGNTPVRESIPASVSLVSLILLLVLGGFMEALQIALFAVKHLPVDVIQANPRAAYNCDMILNTKDGKLQSFLVGRQIAQTVIMFLIARIITVEMKEGADNLFGVSDGIQAFFNSGVLNALVSTIFASLSWRVTANAFPMAFLSNPISIWIIRLCLVVEGTGICDAAWIFAKIHLMIVRYRTDEEFVGKTSSTTVPDQTDTILASDIELGDSSASQGGSNTSEASDTASTGCDASSSNLI